MHMIIDDPIVVTEITAAFEAYEAALMTDDVARMDELFHDASSTVRYGIGEVLYGIEAIREFRQQRGGSPQRSLRRVTIHAYGFEYAVTNAEFIREGSDICGRQSQCWVRFPDGWKIVSAHVSLQGKTS